MEIMGYKSKVTVCTFTFLIKRGKDNKLCFVQTLLRYSISLLQRPQNIRGNSEVTLTPLSFVCERVLFNKLLSLTRYDDCHISKRELKSLKGIASLKIGTGDDEKIRVINSEEFNNFERKTSGCSAHCNVFVY